MKKMHELNDKKLINDQLRMLTGGDDDDGFQPSIDGLTPPLPPIEPEEPKTTN